MVPLILGLIMLDKILCWVFGHREHMQVKFLEKNHYMAWYAESILEHYCLRCGERLYFDGNILKLKNQEGDHGK